MPTLPAAMPTVGERLRRERERRDTTVEQVAQATGIGQGYLEALERNDLGALPGRAFGKFYIRAYAELLDFDPQPLIDDYDRERSSESPRGLAPEPPRTPRRVEAALAQWRASKLAHTERAPEHPGLEPVEEEKGTEETETEEREEGPPIEIAAPSPERPEPAPPREIGPGTPRWPLVAVALALPLVATAIYFAFVDRSPVADETSSSAPTDLRHALPTPTALAPLPTAVPSPSPVEPPAPSTPPGRLRIEAFGVGRRIADRRLEGRTERFVRGQVAWFSTQVLGGRPGDVVRHVWLHEGRVQQTVELPLGGPRWRTNSRKTLGAVGTWEVEARDAQERLLARTSFVCTERVRP